MGLGLGKWGISRGISTLDGVTPIVALLTTDLLRPLRLQVGVSLWAQRLHVDYHYGIRVKDLGLGFIGFRV